MKPKRRRGRRLILLLILGLLLVILGTSVYNIVWVDGEELTWSSARAQLIRWVPERVFAIQAALESEEPLGTREEGSLIVYSTLFEDQLIEYITVFRMQYPSINVIYETMETQELLDRIVAEKSDPRADVIWGLSATSLQLLAWQDALTPYTPANLDVLPSNFRDINEPPMWVGHSVWMNALCVNTALLAEAGAPVPETWSDLTDAQYEGMILMPDPTESQTGFLALQAWMEIYGEVPAWVFMDKLDNNVQDYMESSTGACLEVGEGNAPIAVSYAFIATEQQTNNRDVVAVFPAEGTGWDMEASALVRKFPVKPAARTLMDFIISEEATHFYAQTYAVTAIELDYLPVPFGYPDDPVAALASKDFGWAAANRIRLLNEWQERYGQ